MGFVTSVAAASMFPREPQIQLPQAGHSCLVPSLGEALVAGCAVTEAPKEMQVYHTADSWDSKASGHHPTETTGKLIEAPSSHTVQ